MNNRKNIKIKKIDLSIKDSLFTPKIIKHKKSKIIPKVLVAMSGGVDSSVAAQLLKNKNYEVAGVFLHFWRDPLAGAARENSCCSIASFLDAQATAQKIGIPLYTFNFSEAFKTTVVDNFLSEYQSGRTPNPCVVCNKQIKIGLLLKQAKSLGFDYIATGHYAKLKSVRGETQLFRARDKKKDQSYFLYTFSSQELKSILFPIGAYTKPQVRKLAEKFGLKVASKPESQDICFVSGSHNNFLKRYLSLKSGDIRLLDNDKKIGEHQGLALYTIGQRRGLVDGTGPYYVAKFDYSRNILYVVKKLDEQALYKKELIAQKINWLNGSAPDKSLKCQAVIRYGHQPENCSLSLLTKNKYLVKFSSPQRAISPGQSIVFYDQERVLGGGIIASLA